jgi:hypothetical protein
VVVALLVVVLIAAAIGAVVFAKTRPAEPPSAPTGGSNVDASSTGVDASSTGGSNDDAPRMQRALSVIEVDFTSVELEVIPWGRGSWSIYPHEGQNEDGEFTGLNPGTRYVVTWEGEDGGTLTDTVDTLPRVLTVDDIGFHSARGSVTPEDQGEWSLSPSQGSSKLLNDSNVEFVDLDPGMKYVITWTGRDRMLTMEFTTRASVVEVSNVGFHEAVINVLDTVTQLQLVVNVLDPVAQLQLDNTALDLTSGTVEGLAVGTSYVLEATDEDGYIQRVEFTTRASVVEVSDVGFNAAYITVLRNTPVTLRLDDDMFLGSSSGSLTALAEGTAYVLTATDTDEYVQAVPFQTLTRRLPSLVANTTGVINRTDESLTVRVTVYDPDGKEPSVSVLVQSQLATQDTSDTTLFVKRGLLASTDYSVVVKLDEEVVYTEDARTCDRVVGKCDPATGLAPVTMVCGNVKTLQASEACTVDCVYEYQYADQERPYGDDMPGCFSNPGKHLKKLNVIHQPKNNGTPCPTGDVYEPCVRDLDCLYSEWSAWGRCVGGKQTRQREVLRTESGRGTKCSDDAQAETRECVLSSDYRPGAGEPDQQYQTLQNTAGAGDWLDDDAAFGSLEAARGACSTRAECTGITRRIDEADGDRFYLNGPRARTKSASGFDYLRKLDAHSLGAARYTMAVDDAPCASDDGGRVRCGADTSDALGFWLAPHAGYAGVYTLRDDQGRVCAEDEKTAELRCATVDGELGPQHALAIEDAREMRGGVRGLPCALIDGQVRCDVTPGDAFALTPAAAPGDVLVDVAIGAPDGDGPRVVPYPPGAGALTSMRGRKRFTLSRDGQLGSEQWRNIAGPATTFFEVHLDDARRRLSCWKLDANMARTDEGWDLDLRVALRRTQLAQGDDAPPFEGGVTHGLYTRYDNSAIARGERLGGEPVEASAAFDQCARCGDCAGFSLRDGKATLYRTVDALDNDAAAGQQVQMRTAPSAGRACAYEPAPWSSPLFVPPVLREESSWAVTVSVPWFSALSVFHAWANVGTDLARAFSVARGKKPRDESMALLVGKRNLRKQAGFADTINDTRCVAMWRTGVNPASDDQRDTWLLSAANSHVGKTDSAVWTRRARARPFVVQPGVYTLRRVDAAGYVGARADGQAFVDTTMDAYRADQWPLHLLFELRQAHSGWALRNLATEGFAWQYDGPLMFDVATSPGYTFPLAMQGNDNLVQLQETNSRRFGTRGSDDALVGLGGDDPEQWYELALRTDRPPARPADTDPSPNYVTVRNRRAGTKTVLSELGSGGTLDGAFAECSAQPLCAAVSQNTNTGKLELLASYGDLQQFSGIHLHQNRYYDPYNALEITEAGPSGMPQPQPQPQPPSPPQPQPQTADEPEDEDGCAYEVRSGQDFSVGTDLWSQVGTVAECKDACDQRVDCLGFARRSGDGQPCYFKGYNDSDWTDANSDVVGFMKTEQCTTSPQDGSPAASEPAPASAAVTYTQHANVRQDPTDPRHLNLNDPTGEATDIRTFQGAKAFCDARANCAGFHLNKNKQLYQFKSAIPRLTAGPNFTTWVKDRQT